MLFYRKLKKKNVYKRLLHLRTRLVVNGGQTDDRDKGWFLLWFQDWLDYLVWRGSETTEWSKRLQFPRLISCKPEQIVQSW